MFDALTQMGKGPLAPWAAYGVGVSKESEVYPPFRKEGSSPFDLPVSARLIFVDLLQHHRPPPNFLLIRKFLEEGSGRDGSFSEAKLGS